MLFPHRGDTKEQSLPAPELLLEIQDTTAPVRKTERLDHRPLSLVSFSRTSFSFLLHFFFSLHFLLLRYAHSHSALTECKVNYPLVLVCSRFFDSLCFVHFSFKVGELTSSCYFFFFARFFFAPSEFLPQIFSLRFSFYFHNTMSHEYVLFFVFTFLLLLLYR